MVGSGGVRATVARSGIWSLTGSLAIVLASFLATPFTIRLLGPASYGLWALLQSMLTYLVLADLGMASASTKFAGDRYGKGDGAGEVEAIWTSLAITVVLTALCALGLVFAAPFLVMNILHVSQDLIRPSILAIRIIVVAAVVGSLAGTINTPQTVRLRWGPLTLSNSGPAVIAIVAAPIALVLTSGGVVVMAVVAAVAAALTAAASWLIAVRVQPGLLRPRFSRSLVSPLLRYGGGLTISGVAAIPLSSAERFFLAHNHSTTVVAYYAVAMTIGSVLLVIPAAIAQPMFPALVRLRATGAHEELRQLYRQAQEVIFLTVTPGAIFLSFLAGPLLRLWAGPQYAEHSIFPLLVIVVGMWMNALAMVPYTYLLASGRTSLIAKIHLAELLPYLAAAAVLTAALGALGAAVAWSSRVALDTFLFVATCKRHGRLPWAPTSTRVSVGLVVPASLAACTALLSTVTNSLAVRGACATALLLVYIVVVWKFVLTTPERSGMRSLASLLLPHGGQADS